MESGQFLKLPKSEQMAMEGDLRRQARLEDMSIEIKVKDNGDGTVDFAWTVGKLAAAVNVTMTPAEDTGIEKPIETATAAATTTPVAAIPGDASEPDIAFGKKVSKDFKAKVIKIAAELEMNVDHLMAAMAFETGATFDPAVRNAAGSGATGLIQFMPKTAIGLGTTTDDLADMTAVEQLDFVRKYFLPHKGKLHELEDVYMAILFPLAIGKELNFVLFERPSKAYDQNKGLDMNFNGKVTKGEAAAKVRIMLDKGLKATRKG